MNLGDIPSNAPIPLDALAADATAATVPAGTILATGRSTAPTGYLMCDGSAVSRTGTTLNLFNAIGTAYGVGNGSTTFNLPDLKGRVPVGKGTNADVDALGESDGLAEASRKPKHLHTVASHTHGINAEAPATNTVGAHTHGIFGQTGDANYNVNGGADAGSGFNHTHFFLANTDSQGNHAHTVNAHSHGGVTGGTAPATDAQGPAYQTVNYMIRI